MWLCVHINVATGMLGRKSMGMTIGLQTTVYLCEKAQLCTPHCLPQCIVILWSVHTLPMCICSVTIYLVCVQGCAVGVVSSVVPFCTVAVHTVKPLMLACH